MPSRHGTHTHTFCHANANRKTFELFFHASWHIFPGRCSNCPSRLLVLARVHVMNVFASVSLCNYKWQSIWWRSSADKFLKTGLGGVSVDEEVEAVYGSSFPRGVITINPEVINRQHCPILVMLCFMDMFCMCYFFSLLFFAEFEHFCGCSSLGLLKSTSRLELIL